MRPPDTMTGPPSDIFPYVQEFCHSLSPRLEPFFVNVAPGLSDAPLDCMSNVQRRIAIQGGGSVLGWKIWEWYGVMIEAEFHMMWRSPDGRVLDVTPNTVKFDRVLFLPDPSQTYVEGKQVNNIRRPLISNARVAEFIAVADRTFAILNAGGRANVLSITVSAEERRELQALELLKVRLVMQIERTQPGRNELCRCGSGKKFKRCHGRGH